MTYTSSCSGITKNAFEGDGLDIPAVVAVRAQSTKAKLTKAILAEFNKILVHIKTYPL